MYNNTFSIPDAKKILKSRFFPIYNKGSKNNFKHIVVLGLGGNIGNVCKRFDRLIRMWKNERRFCVIKTSPLLLNKAFGYTAQDDFINAIVYIKTNLDPFSILKIMQHYEKRLGRIRSFKNAPRTLDIDILYFDDLKLKTRNLIIPHKGINSRPSVIIPLGLM